MNPPQKTLTEDEEEEEGEGEEECGAEEGRNKSGCHRNLELRLGMAFSATEDEARASGINGVLNSRFLKCMHETKHRMNGLEPGWFFSKPSSGFIDPWSLAGRQQKAVLEQAHKRTCDPNLTSPAFSRETRLPPPSVAVGWPPVRSFRRNMVGSQAPRPAVEDERKAKRAKIGEGITFNDCDEANGAMFVKVNMEGYAVGRKIDLRSHVNYDSLSDSLKKMFLNFLSLDYPEEYKVENRSHDFLLLYEDHEGDRMLVGDVPWEMFITSVKRLYIVRSPKPEEVRVSLHADMDN